MRVSGLCETLIQSAIAADIDHIKYLNRFLHTLKRDLEVKKAMLLEFYHGIVCDTADWYLKAKENDDNLISLGNKNINNINMTIEHNWYERVQFLETQKASIQNYLKLQKREK